VPELPEVETVRRTIERALVGKKISEAEIVPDEIVLKGIPHTFVHSTIINRTVTAAGRKGKYFWLELDEKPWLFAHLGMAGWLREIGEPTIRLREHGEAPMEDEDGRPRFLKMMLTAEDGRKIAMTDGRRLSRIWLCESPDKDSAISKLGRDCYLDLPSTDDIYAKLVKKNAPIKAILLDQAVFAGIGNWIADEVLYVAGIRPSRLGSSLSSKETGKLRDAIQMVIGHAVEVGADKEQFPKTWLFHARWGGKSGEETLEGEKIIREQIGGRTTAWVPSKQK
jgi:formamidopyrimidine-DNA glycosylase